MDPVASRPAAPVLPEAAFTPLSVAIARVVALLDAPAPLLVVSDFDGTLSRIDPDPLGARIEPLGRLALRRLARIAVARPDRLRVVVLSGRTALDVAARVRVGGLDYLGNHGLEAGALPARVRAERLAVSFDARLQGLVGPALAFGDAVAAQLGWPAWLFVERKGPAVAFHFRAAPDPAAAQAALEAAIGLVESATPFGGMVRMTGRRIIEFQPEGVAGKGRAALRLLERDAPGSMLILGDDRSDAEAFRVLRSARAAGTLAGLTVAVHGAAETPPEVLDAADILLPSPHAAARLLSALGREAERRLRPGQLPELLALASGHGPAVDAADLPPVFESPPPGGPGGGGARGHGSASDLVAERPALPEDR